MSTTKQNVQHIRQSIADGRTSLGIELGSTRIKAVLIDESFQPIASGEFQWENRLEGGFWTYDMEDAWTALQTSYAQVVEDVKKQYDMELLTVGSIGISAMMHGYLPFDKEGNQLAAFRTWRNTTTEQAAAFLTEEFAFNVPQRWSIAHLYQAILNDEEHVSKVDFLTTLSGYIHWKLTGEKVLGVGEASGMFPIDSDTNDYHAVMLQQFAQLDTVTKYPWKVENIMPKVLVAGEAAGRLTKEGALLIDPTGKLAYDIPLCPPEGDAGTGMVATNSIAENTGNVSAGTSVFAMIVLEKALSQVYMEIDMVTTPSGKPVAMVHCNNFTSDLDAWIRLMKEFGESVGCVVETYKLYDALYFSALEGDSDCGGLLSYNYYSGEPITHLEEGRPLFVRTPDSRFTMANFSRNLIFSALATLKIGMDILTENEHVSLKQLQGHGGFFKTERVGQQLMAAALKVPVAVMASASEGGAWGIALLARFLIEKEEGQTLENFLEQKVFVDSEITVAQPQPEDVAGFDVYIERYQKGLAIQRAAVESLDILGDER